MFWEVTCQDDDGLDFEELLLTQRQLLILGICQPLRLIGIWTLLEEQIKSPGKPLLEGQRRECKCKCN